MPKMRTTVSDATTLPPPIPAPAVQAVPTANTPTQAEKTQPEQALPPPPAIQPPPRPDMAVVLDLPRFGEVNATLDGSFCYTISELPCDCRRDGFRFVAQDRDGRTGSVRVQIVFEHEGRVREDLSPSGRAPEILESMRREREALLRQSNK